MKTDRNRPTNRKTKGQLPDSRSTRRNPAAPETLEGRIAPASFLVTTHLDVINGTDGVTSLREAIIDANATGNGSQPDDIRFAEALPKTRSGKIMRRLLKQIATGGEIKGDTTTLEDFNVIARLSQAEE